MIAYLYTALFGVYILGAAWIEQMLQEWIEDSIRTDSKFREMYGEEYGKISGVITALLWGPIVILTVLYWIGKGMKGIIKKEKI